MKEVVKQSILPYSSKELFELVNAVSEYPEFLPGCQETIVHESGQDRMDVTVKIVKGAVKLEFRTLNYLKINERIEMNLKSGPFKSLRGEWLFDPLSEHSSKISFRLRFAFNSFLLDKMLGHVVSNLAQSMISAFEQRAEEIYGRR